MANKNIFIFAFFLGLISLAISLWLGIAMAQHQKPFNNKDMSITGACLIISAMFIGMGGVLTGVIFGFSLECMIKNSTYANILQ